MHLNHWRWWLARRRTSRVLFAPETFNFAEVTRAIRWPPVLRVGASSPASRHVALVHQGRGLRFRSADPLPQ